MAAARELALLRIWTFDGDRLARKAGVLVLGALAGLALGREVIREVTPGPHGHHGKTPPEISAPPPVVAKLESWINANTDANSRILFETSLGRVHGGGHTAGYLAATTRREFMGAAYPYFTPRLSCWDRSCFGHRIGDLQPALFRQVADAYNVGWAIAHSAELKAFLQGLPGVKAVADIDGISVYQVDGPRTFVLEGKGRVLGRDFNRVALGDVSGPLLTLRYNWVPGLETVPPSEVQAYVWSADFPPLVRIINPPVKFILRMAD